MSRQEKVKGMNRRKFIKTAGLVTGALATYPLQAHAKAFFSNPPAITVGVLSPRSSIVPLMGENFIAGMKLQFAEAGWNNLKMFVEDIGDSPRFALAKAQKLITEQNVNLLAGFLNPLNQPRLLKILKESLTPFINVEGGANIPTAAAEHLLISHNSLGYWQANLAMGDWAASRLGRRVFIASSLYESGYDSSYAFRAGFKAAGGEVLQNSVTRTSAKDELDALMASIRESSPDFVYAMFSGKEAVAFVKAYSDAGLAGQIPLAASPFMVDESILPAMGEDALGIKSCLSWAPGLEPPENVAFQKEYALANGRNADIFAVLGYETAQMITGTVTSSSMNIPQAVRTASFDGPRGPFSMNGQNGYADTPLYLREVSQVGDSLGNTVLEKLPPLSRWSKLEDRTINGMKSGWTNAFLCI